MAGQRQKHPDALVFRRGDRVQPLAPIVAGWSGPIPRLPKSTRREVSRVWRELFSSQLSGAFKPTDIPTLRRWAWWIGQWMRVAEEVETEELVSVSVLGGAKLNPKVRYLKQCETALRELEKAFGMDALARLRLGITLADGAAKAAALKQPVKPEAM